MCFKENTFNIINKTFFIINFTLPLLYLIYFLFIKEIKRKRKKRSHKKIGFYLVALIIFIVIYFFRGEILKVDICKSKDNNEITTTTTKAIPAINSENYYGKTSKGYIIEKIDDVFYIDDYLIVNKTYSLSKEYIPKDTNIKVTNDLCILCIDNTAYDNWKIMKNDAAAIGLEIKIVSGYRSYNYQKNLYDGNVIKDGKNLTDTYSARPGHSEHQTGLSFDINSTDDSFAATNEGKWLNENAYLYGYIIRYPKGKEHITGYQYEPWHLRYVGKKLAKILYNNGEWITMEEYFGIDSKYK